MPSATVLPVFGLLFAVAVESVAVSGATCPDCFPRWEPPPAKPDAPNGVRINRSLL